MKKLLLIGLVVAIIFAVVMVSKQFWLLKQEVIELKHQVRDMVTLEMVEAHVATLDRNNWSAKKMAGLGLSSAVPSGLPSSSSASSSLHGGGGPLSTTFHHQAWPNYYQTPHQMYNHNSTTPQPHSFSSHTMPPPYATPHHHYAQHPMFTQQSSPTLLNPNPHPNSWLAQSSNPPHHATQIINPQPVYGLNPSSNHSSLPSSEPHSSLPPSEPQSNTHGLNSHSMMPISSTTNTSVAAASPQITTYRNNNNNNSNNNNNNAESEENSAETLLQQSTTTFPSLQQQTVRRSEYQLGPSEHPAMPGSEPMVIDTQVQEDKQQPQQRQTASTLNQPSSVHGSALINNGVPWAATTTLSTSATPVNNNGVHSSSSSSSYAAPYSNQFSFSQPLQPQSSFSSTSSSWHPSTSPFFYNPSLK